MKTVILSGRTQRGKNKLQIHGTKWEVLKIDGNRFLVQSMGSTFHIGGGIMEKDWRFVQTHFDKDFKIEMGGGQATPPPIKREALVPDVQVSLLEALRNDRQVLNHNLQSLKGGKKQLCCS